MASKRISFSFVLTNFIFGLVLFALAPVLRAADTVTLPVAASTTGQGGVPFVSDVRVFNTSYTDVLSVTAVYRFNAATQTFSLQPRQAMAFDDIGGNLFASPQSLGAVEFTSDKVGLLVTSQLRSPADGGGHVGMFVPGLPSSAASAVSVLTSLVNGDSRTNVGVYNPNGVSVTATIRLFDGDVLLGTTSVTLGAKAVTQVNNIYSLLGFGGLVKTDGYATVESGDGVSALFTYAAEADNTSKDLILIVGSPDVPAPPGFNPPPPTATGGSTNPTPTPTPTPPAATIHTVNVGQTGTSFTDVDSGSHVTTVHVGDTVKWVWMSGPHSTTSGTCSGGGGYYGAPSCDGDGSWDTSTHTAGYTFSRTFLMAGTFKYFCSVHQDAMTGTVQVQP